MRRTINYSHGLIVILLSVMLLLSIQTPVVFASQQTIIPGIVWKDTSNNVIQAHGEGMIQVGSTYYWFGEDKTNGSHFQNINCYWTTDLTHFNFNNHVLTLQSSGDLGPNRIVERPKVIFNSSTNTYVMYMHIDNTSYTERKVGVATSGSVCGNYSYRGSFQPLGNQSLDMSLFKDSNGTGYLLSEDRANKLTRIDKLSSDYLSVVSSVYGNSADLEAPAMMKIGSTYYLFGSHQSGWSTNDNEYITATNLAGPWSNWSTFAPVGSHTCNSQTAYILPVQGSQTTSYIYLGDRWNSTNLSDSRYIWLPLTVNGTSVSMTCYSSWVIDPVTGVWSQSGSGSTPTFVPNKSYEAESSSNTLAGGAKIGSCSSCSGGSKVGWLGNAAGTLTFNGVSGSASQITVYYCNGDSTPRNAQIRVNGGAPITVSFNASGGGVVVASKVVSLTLNSGSNTIKFSNDTSGQWAPDIDRITVP